jgi:hypothetical protein
MNPTKAVDFKNSGQAVRIDSQIVSRVKLDFIGGEIMDEANSKQSVIKKKTTVSRTIATCFKDKLVLELGLKSRDTKNVMPDMKVYAEATLLRYSNSLDNIARTNTLSWNGNARLSEAELFVESINAPLIQSSKAIAKLRTETKVVGELISAELLGGKRILILIDRLLTRG